MDPEASEDAKGFALLSLLACQNLRSFLAARDLDPLKNSRWWSLGGYWKAAPQE
jgi:hypothetical protein